MQISSKLHKSCNRHSRETQQGRCRRMKASAKMKASATAEYGLPSQAWLPARTYVREAIETRAEVDESGEIIKLAHYCPWKEHLYELEEELSLPQQIKFCLYEVWRTPSPKRSSCSGHGES